MADPPTPPPLAVPSGKVLCGQGRSWRLVKVEARGVCDLSWLFVMVGRLVGGWSMAWLVVIRYW